MPAFWHALSNQKNKDIGLTGGSKVLAQNVQTKKVI